ncbi:MAG: hypothetical protein LQ342_002248 [Letrouitia transgressa]|nr:MAG: hypothetical protein LQ342_002248 [Letrouitia transgressa]
MLRRLPVSQTQYISELEHNEASALLFKSARLDVSEEYQERASRIVAELGCLALAVDQAGAYIASGECHLDDFLDTFNAHRQYLLQNEAYRGASGNDRTVYTTMDLSYAAIARQADSTANEVLRQGLKAALQILEVIPFFHNEGILKDIFRSAAQNPKTRLKNDTIPLSLLSTRPDGSWESQSFRQGIRTLLSFSLIGQESSQRHFFMHRLVHLWAYDRLTAAEKDRFGNRTQHLLAKSIIWRIEAGDYAFRRDLLPHIATFQRLTGFPTTTEDPTGMNGFALALIEAGRWKKVEELRAQMLEINRRALGEEHPDTLKSINNLALTYSSQERYKDAEALQVRVLDIRKSTLGEEHPDTLKSINDLALTYDYQERHEDAEALLSRVLDTRKSTLGEEHPQTLDSTTELYLTYYYQGRLEEAEALAVLALETSKKVLGEEHPDTLIILPYLAVILKSRGRKEEAIALLEKCLKLWEHVFGSEHPLKELFSKVLKRWKDEDNEISVQPFQ